MSRFLRRFCAAVHHTAASGGGKGAEEKLKVTSEMLHPGIELRLLETDRFKSAGVCVEMLLPLRKETASKAALLVSVLRHACAEYPDPRSVAKCCDRMYSTGIGTVNERAGEIQIIGLADDFLSDECLPDGEEAVCPNIDLVGKFLFEPYLRTDADGKPCFDGDFLEQKKKDLIDAIREQINNKVGYAVRRGQEETCRGEAFAVSVLGSEEAAREITARQLYEFYLETVAGAYVVITYVGRKADARRREALRKIADRFAEAGRDGSRRSLPSTEVIRRSETAREVVEEQPVKQGKMTLGFRTGKTLSDGDYYKFVMFNEVFGGSPTSRLFMNVREKLSLCYYCSSFAEPQKGVMFVASGIENDNREKARAEILAQLADIAAGNITDQELESARKSVLSAYKAIYDSPAAIKRWYTGRMLAGITTSPEEASEQIRSVTAADVAACAAGVSFACDYFMHGNAADNAEEGEEEEEE